MKKPKKLTFGRVGGQVARSRYRRKRNPFLSTQYMREMNLRLGWCASASYHVAEQLRDLRAAFSMKPQPLPAGGIALDFAAPGGSVGRVQQWGPPPDWGGIIREVERAEFAGQQMRNFHLSRAHYRTLPALVEDKGLAGQIDRTMGAIINYRFDELRREAGL